MTSGSTLQLKHNSPQELLSLASSCFKSGSVSILAGHYLLVYSYLRAELVPLIASEPLEQENPEPFLGLVRDFPEVTFRLGLDILSSIGINRAKLLLLVDDVTVRLVQDIPAEMKLSDLRRRYFHRAGFAPIAFLRELAERQLSPGDVLEPNSTRRASSTLPTNTYLFSEHILRSRFRRKTRKKLATLKDFQFQVDPLTTSVFFGKSGYFDSACVIEGNGEQTCSGTALTLMDLLRARRYHNLVWFLPSGCRESVTRAVILAVRELGWFRKALLIYESFDPGAASIKLRDGLLIGEIEG